MFRVTEDASGVNVGVVGCGNVGSTLAELLADAGHAVAVSNSRDPETLAGFADALGSRARAVTPADAVRFGDVVVVAIPFRNRDELPDASLFADAVVVDATNPYANVDPDDPTRSGFAVMDLDGRTSSELIAEQLPDARVVKGFNAVNVVAMRERARPDAPRDERLVVFVAGDHDDAKQTASGLVADAGFAPVDLGPLVAGGRLLEPDAPLYNTLVTPPEVRDATARAAGGEP